MHRLLVLLLACSCGRVAFDPRTDASGGGGDDDPDLLLHFTFESDGFLHDRAGTKDATCSDCPTPADGPRPGTRAAAFDGTACLTVDAGFVMPPAFTYAVWVDLADARSETVFGRPYDSGQGSINSFELWTDGVFVVAEINSNARVNFPRPVGGWQHIAGTYDGSEFVVYRDGVLDARAGTPPPLYTNEGFTIGCDRDANVLVTRLLGRVDGVRLYGRALGPAEIAAVLARGD